MLQLLKCLLNKSRFGCLNRKSIFQMQYSSVEFAISIWHFDVNDCMFYQSSKGKKRKRVSKGSASTSGGTSSKRSAKV